MIQNEGPLSSLMEGKPLTSEEIKALIPHRFPFLLVDRVLKIENDAAIGLKNVTANEPFFQGHFPGQAVMPGVLMVEALAQLAGIIEYKRLGAAGAINYFIGIDKVRFRDRVVPGDQLILEVRLLKRKGKFAFAHGQAKVEDRIVCEGELMFIVDMK